MLRRAIEPIDHGMLLLHKHGLERSPCWRSFMRRFLKKHPACLVCGRTDLPRNLHHKYPAHFVISLGRPDLELDERNAGFVLCVEHSEEHHLLVGHLGSWESFNPQLEYFLALCRNLLAVQIRAMPAWTAAVAQRPKPLADMTEPEKTAFRQMLDTHMPL